MNAVVSTDQPGLVDQFGRRIDYVRLSVTDRCDLRCSYCMPEGFKGFEDPEHWLNFDEIERLIGAFARLGVRRIRLTGGEPLLRRNIAGLAGRIAALPGIEDLSLSTNATQLDKHAEALKAAGVTRLNVSLDSLQQARVERINGRDVLAKVMTGLAAAQDAGFAPIKLNMVALRGTNDDEIDEMVAFCMERGFVLRLIEAMPMGDTGRNAEYLDLQPVKERLRTQFGLVETALSGGGPARYLGTSDGRFNVGFITPISQHFCETCNRIRIAVDGTAYMCLGQEEKFEFRPLLREGCSDAELEAAILHAIDLKPERHEFREAPHKIQHNKTKTNNKRHLHPRSRYENRQKKHAGPADRNCGNRGISATYRSPARRRAIPHACGTRVANSRDTDPARSPDTARTDRAATPTPCPIEIPVASSRAATVPPRAAAGPAMRQTPRPRNGSCAAWEHPHARVASDRSGVPASCLFPAASTADDWLRRPCARPSRLPTTAPCAGSRPHRQIRQRPFPTLGSRRCRTRKPTPYGAIFHCRR